MSRIDPALQERLVDLVSSMGYEWVGCETVSQGRLVVRIYIDSPMGLTVDACSDVSRQVSAMLDVEASFQGHYVLEVSSPGIERPLFTLAHYQKFTGSQVRIKLSVPIDQRRQYKGIIQRVEGEDIYLQVDGFEEEQKLPFRAIEKANLIVDLRV